MSTGVEGLLDDRPGEAPASASTARGLAYGTGAQVAGRVVGAISSIAALRLSTNYLGVDRYGAVVTALSFLALLATFADLGLTTITARELSRGDADAGRLLGTNLALRIALSLVLIPVAMATAWLVYQDEDSVRLAILVLAPVLVIGAVRTSILAVFIARGRTQVNGLLDAAGCVLALLGVWAAVTAELPLAGYLVASLVAATLTAVMAFSLARRHVRPRLVIDVAAWRSLFVLALPLGVIELMNVVYLRVDSLILSVARGAAEVGHYGVAYKVVEFTMAIPTFMMLALLPALVGAAEARRRRLLQRAFDVLVTLGVLAAVLGVLLARPVVVAVSSPAFATASTALAILLVGAGASFVSAVHGHALVLADHQRRLIPLTLVVVGLNLVLNVLTVPRYGIGGAAASTAFCELLAMFWVTRLHREMTGWRPRYGQLPRAFLAAACTVGMFLVLRRMDLAVSRPSVWLLVTGVTLVTTYVAALAAVRGLPRLGQA